jgi:hypothetical protein
MKRQSSRVHAASENRGTGDQNHIKNKAKAQRQHVHKARSGAIHMQWIALERKITVYWKLTPFKGGRTRADTYQWDGELDEGSSETSVAGTREWRTMRDSVCVCLSVCGGVTQVRPWEEERRGRDSREREAAVWGFARRRKRSGFFGIACRGRRLEDALDCWISDARSALAVRKDCGWLIGPAAFFFKDSFQFHSKL